MQKPYIFDDPGRILAATWTEFAAACFEYEIPTDTTALAVIGIHLDAAMLSPLVALVKANWEIRGTLLDAVAAAAGGPDLSEADALRLRAMLERSHA